MKVLGQTIVFATLLLLHHGLGLPMDDESLILQMTTEAAITEPEISSISANTEGSILDYFSTSSKEKKIDKAEIKSIYVKSNVTFRYAKTRIESQILNPAQEAQEVFFDVILPESAFISGFSMEIDGKVYEAYVKEKKEAQKVYDNAVKKGITAGHVKQSARDSNRFSVSVNVEPQKKVRFNLTYEELLERRYGVYRHVINLNPGQIVDDLSVDVQILENKEIIKLRVPEFQSGNEVYPVLDTKDNQLAVVERLSKKEVKISFRPSAEDQKKLQNQRKKENSNDIPEIGVTFEGLSGQFAVEYDVDRDVAGDVLVNDGYFVHFFAPPDVKPLKKHAIFVLDVSGSMQGRKIEQLKQAMEAILSELNPEDYFNIVEFAYTVDVRDLDSPEPPRNTNVWMADVTNSSDNATEVLKPFKATPHYIEKGKEVVQKMSAAGGTNIYDALNVAMKLAKTGRTLEAMRGEMASLSDSSLPEPMIIFLTDGEPTVGETSESKILRNLDENNNDPRVPIFSLAFGTDADYNLLKRVSLLTNAFARQIYEAADTSLQLRNFYKQISSPLLSRVKFVYPPEQVKSDTITKVNFANFFGGSELVVAGKLKEDTVEGQLGRVEALTSDGMHNYSVNHVNCFPKVPKEERTYKPLERLWVYMTIKQLLDEAELMKARSYLIDYKDETKTPLHDPPEEKALRLALEAAKNAVYSFARIIINCLTAKLKMLQSLFQYLSNDFEYLDSGTGKASKSINDTIMELAVKYSFVCPLTSLVVVKPESTSDTNVEPATSARPNPLAVNAAALTYNVKYKADSSQISRIGTGGGFHASAVGAGFYRPLGISGGLGSAAPTKYVAYPPAPGAPGAPESYKLGHLSTTPPTVPSIQSITWLSDVLKNGTILRFPNDINATEYLLGASQANDPFGSCTVASTGATGICRHLEYCVIPEIVSDVNKYFPDFFCLIPGNYAGICCPEAPSSVPTP